MIPRRVRLDDRQADRVGPGPRRGARPPAARARRHDGRDRRRRRRTRASCSTCSTAPSSAAGDVDTDLARPAAPARRDRPGTPRRHRPAAGGDRARRGRDGGRARALLSRSPAAAGRRRRAATVHTVELRHRGQPLPDRGRAGRARPPPRQPSTARPSRSRCDRLGAHERRLELDGADPPDAHLAARRRPARRGRRRAAPDLPRRRRHRPQPRAGRRGLHPRRRPATRSRPATSSPWSRA